MIDYSKLLGESHFAAEWIGDFLFWSPWFSHLFQEMSITSFAGKKHFLRWAPLPLSSRPVPYPWSLDHASSHDSSIFLSSSDSDFPRDILAIIRSCMTSSAKQNHVTIKTKNIACVVEIEARTWGDHQFCLSRVPTIDSRNSRV